MGQELKCWTFHLRGGEPIGIHMRGNPPVSHDGRLSIWHLMMGEKMSTYLSFYLQGKGVQVDAMAEEESPEQAQERAAMSDPNREYQTPLCSLCFFLDLNVLGECGYWGWPEEMLTMVLEGHEKARKDAQVCPALEVRGCPKIGR